MRRITLVLLALGLTLALCSCSSKPPQSKNNSDFKIAISSSSQVECSNGYDENHVVCSFPIQITSLARSPKSISGNFFARVDGKIFQADTSYGGTKSISDTWNPDESKSAVIPFIVPKESHITSLFLGSAEVASIKDAVLSLIVNVTALDGWTPELQLKFNSKTSVDELIKRIRISTNYPFTTHLDDSEIPHLVARFARKYPGNSLKDGKIIPQVCFGTIFTDTKNSDFKAISEGEYIVFKDSKTGMGILLQALVAEDKPYCSSILQSVPGMILLK